MRWLIAAIYDRFLQASEEACLSQWRAELLSDLAGEVLEVGAGTGLNLPHYPDAVTRLVISEPDYHMRKKLQEKRASVGIVRVEYSEASLDKLPMRSELFDVVVATLVL
ncbi:MAG: class I SAM-dependent methyltransferase, partial [bacterium]